EGATLAYRLGLTFPEKFAGIISLNGAMPRHTGPLFRLPQARQLRVLIGHGIANAVIPLSMAREDFRLFYAAGISVRMFSYPATHKLHPDMLRDINRWIMAQINGEAARTARLREFNRASRLRTTSLHSRSLSSTIGDSR